MAPGRLREHHLAFGVSQVLVSDNRSIDATPDILADYAPRCGHSGSSKGASSSAARRTLATANYLSASVTPGDGCT